MARAGHFNGREEEKIIHQGPIFVPDKKDSENWIPAYGYLSIFEKNVYLHVHGDGYNDIMPLHDASAYPESLENRNSAGNLTSPSNQIVLRTQVPDKEYFVISTPTDEERATWVSKIGRPYNRDTSFMDYQV